MTRRIVACSIAAVAACGPADSLPRGPVDSATDSMADTLADGGDVAASGSTDAASGSTDAAGDDSTAASECERGREPADFGEVAGCREVFGSAFCSEGQGHVPIGTEIEWASNPPHSGPHFPMWALWGAHDEPVERGYWVHNLEHGGIVLLYLCPGGCDAQLQVLHDVVALRPDRRVLLTSDPSLGTTGFVAVSWTWVYWFPTPVLEDLLCFVDQHFNHAPEDVP